MKYNVTVNGKKYEVEIERAPSAAVETPVQKPVAPAAPKAAAPAGGAAVSAPMPGTIADIKVTVGSPVKKGQVLVILEAMKMENEILADTDAVVEHISVTKGSAVSTGDTLLTLK